MSDLADPTDELTSAEHAAAMADYLVEGQARAKTLGNRGAIRFDHAGKLHPEILDSYWEHGFYVFEDLVDPDEVELLRTEVEDMVERAPTNKGSDLDAQGRPALGRDYAIEPYLFVKPLSDPWGGTDLLSGRHPTKMAQPTPEGEAPANVVHLMFGMCQAMPSALRLYGHPALLTIAEGINGADFVPYNDAIFVKKPGLGGSVSWHQDGVTHWDSPDWDHGIHGFNFQVQLYPSTPANGLWVLPGTHKLGRLDIKQMVADNGGNERLPGAVPLFCDAGGVTIANRQLLHGSFANTSPDPRVSITFGFHRRTSVLGQQGGLNLGKFYAKGGDVYDENRLFDRSAVIAVAIDARSIDHPDEARYVYEPFVGLEDDFRFNDDTFERVIKDYNTKDLAI